MLTFPTGLQQLIHLMMYAPPFEKRWAGTKYTSLSERCFRHVKTEKDNKKHRKMAYALAYVVFFV